MATLLVQYIYISELNSFTPNVYIKSSWFDKIKIKLSKAKTARDGVLMKPNYFGYVGADEPFFLAYYS